MLFEDEPYTQPELNVISAVQIDLSRLKNGERLRERTFVEYDGGRVGFLDVNLRRSRTSYKLTRLPAAIVNEVWEDVYRYDKTFPLPQLYSSLLRSRSFSVPVTWLTNPSLQLSENDFSVGEPLPPLLAQAQKLYYLSLMGCRLRFIPNPVRFMCRDAAELA